MPSVLLASALFLFITLSYVTLCAASPFGDCRKCHGWGHAIKTDRKGRTKRGKDCRHCKATGKRIRVGRHLYNVAARLHRDGTR
ncbi:hypothetical protein ACWD9X_23480 [Streptomyces sp. NPDC005075]|uniref:hypothetical protein n=1 Tax=Streptomyces sp. NPDC079189 TaxID=3154514 RepID=UPI0034123C20